MKYIEKQIEMLKHAIDNGIVSKDSSLLIEQKDLIIDYIFCLNEEIGTTIDKSRLGAIIDKLFAEKLGID